MLAEAQPQFAWPSPQTIRRWFRAAELAHAPAGRRPGASAAGRAPHQTWQIDASEHIPLADKTEVCWLRIVDEATGAVLRTDVFPPRLLDPGRPRRHPDGAEAGVPAVGPARAAEGRQRCALGIAGRPAHRPGLLAGGPGCRGDRQPASSSPGQWRGGEGARGGQAVVRALDVRLRRRVATASGGDGPSAAGSLSGHAGSVPPGPPIPGLRHSGRPYDPAREETTWDLQKVWDLMGRHRVPRQVDRRRQGLGVQPAAQRGDRVGRPNGLGGLRPVGWAMDVPG